MTTPDGTDPLRLSFCPQCDYDLTGLPPAGACPECGRAYDSTFVVLRGRPAIDSGWWSGRVGRRVIAVLGWASFAAALWFLWRNAHDAIVPFFVGLLAFGGLLKLMVRLSSPRPGEVLVWMSPTGVGQQPAADPTSWAGRLSRAAPWLMLAAALVLMGWFRHVDWAGAVAVQLVMIPISAGLAWWGRPRAVLPADGLRPPLYAWCGFAEVSLLPVGDRHRLIGRHDNWYARRQRTVCIDLALSPDASKALQARLHAYRGRGPVPARPAGVSA